MKQLIGILKHLRKEIIKQKTLFDSDNQKYDNFIKIIANDENIQILDNVLSCTKNNKNKYRMFKKKKK